MASASSNAEGIQQLITCGVCLDTLDKPVIFPCIHHFCKKCKTQLSIVDKDGVLGVLCPTCRQFAADDSIKENFVMEQLVDLHTQKSTIEINNKNCDVCMKVNATHRCIECKMEICHDCKLGHLRIPALKGHTVKEIESRSETENVINTVVFCPEHPDKIIEFSCVDCNKAICYKCKILNHDKHSTNTIEDAISKLIPEVERKLEPIETDIALLTNKIEGLEQLETETKEREAELVAEIERKRSELVEKLNKDAAALTEEIEIKYQAKSKELSIEKNDAVYQLSSKQSVNTWAKTVLGHFQEVNLLLQLQGDLMNTLDQHQNQTSTDQSVEVTNLHQDISYMAYDYNMIGTTQQPPLNVAYNEARYQEITTKSKPTSDIVVVDDRHRIRDEHSVKYDHSRVTEPADLPFTNVFGGNARNTHNQVIAPSMPAVDYSTYNEKVQNTGECLAPRVLQEINYSGSVVSNSSKNKARSKQGYVPRVLLENNYCGSVVSNSSEAPSTQGYAQRVLESNYSGLVVPNSSTQEYASFVSSSRKQNVQKSNSASRYAPIHTYATCPDSRGHKDSNIASMAVNTTNREKVKKSKCQIINS